MRRPLLLIYAALSLGALGGCADGNPMKDLAQAAGVGGEPKPAPDFVTRTRAASYDYMPVGESAPKRRLKPKDVAGVAGAEADLDGVKARNEAVGNTARKAGSSVLPTPPAPKPPAN